MNENDPQDTPELEAPAESKSGKREFAPLAKLPDSDEVLIADYAERGLMLVGLDVIGSHLTEINVTSPTCMVEIRQQTGFDAAGAFITAIEHACGIS